jgi:hypothetical protein
MQTLGGFAQTFNGFFKKESKSDLNYYKYDLFSSNFKLIQQTSA